MQDGVLIQDDRDAQHGFRFLFNSKAKLRKLHEEGCARLGPIVT